MLSTSETGNGPRAAQPAARRKFRGRGLEGQGLTAGEIEQLGSVIARRLGIDSMRPQEPPRVDELELHAPRLAPPASLTAAFSTDPYERAVHTYGRSFRDLVRAFRGDFAHAPDLVAFPRDEGELVSVLEWCAGAGAAAIPFGGGSSVAGGVEPDVGDGYRGAVSVDLRHLSGVLEVDHASRAARIAGGTLGPVRKAQLKPHGLTLRHYPQSFEWSTLGGWIATRSGGHFAPPRPSCPRGRFVPALQVRAVGWTPMAAITVVPERRPPSRCPAVLEYTASGLCARPARLRVPPWPGPVCRCGELAMVAAGASAGSVGENLRVQWPGTPDARRTPPGPSCRSGQTIAPVSAAAVTGQKEDT